MSAINKTRLIISGLMEHYGFRTDLEFAEMLGVPPTTLSSWKSRDSIDLNLVYAKCVGVDGNFLLTGKGDPFPVNNVVVSEPKSDYENLKKIPIIDIEAAAGSGLLNSDYIEPIGFIELPANSLHSKTATYYAIRSRGDSMFPTIYDQDLMIIRQLERGEWAELRNEYVYVVVDIYGKSYVKRIKNRLSRGFVVLMSDNLDKINYPNFTLEENELHHFFYAELKISAHFPNINATYFDRLKELEDRVDEMDIKLKRLNK